MNLRMIGTATAALLLSLCSAEPGILAASRTAGTIVATGQMAAARFDHAAVLLSTGRVLIVATHFGGRAIFWPVSDVG